MKYRNLLLLMMFVVSFSCKKHTEIITQPPLVPTTPTVPEVPQVQTALLKEVLIPNLPSPFYHFEYDTEGKVAAASFASGFTIYTVAYSGNRISEMKNNIIVNKDRLQYTYDAEGKVIEIKYADSTGEVYKTVLFIYHGPRLVKAGWKKKSGGDFILERSITFFYYDDGNLMEMLDHRLPIAGQDEYVLIDRYEQYDNKINNDAFMLLHDGIHDHLFLLPGVQIQKNNPGRQIRTGDGFNFTIDYTYTYNDRNVVVTKKGEGLILTGNSAGQHIKTNATYTYY
jgi:hypothetical protein